VRRDGQEREDGEGGERGEDREDLGTEVEGVPELAGSDVNEDVAGILMLVADIAVVVVVTQTGVESEWHVCIVCSIAFDPTRDARRADNGECCPGAERGARPVGVRERGRCVLQNTAHALRVEGFVMPGAAALAVGGSLRGSACELERVQFCQRRQCVDGGCGCGRGGGDADRRERQNEHKHERGLDREEARAALPALASAHREVAYGAKLLLCAAGASAPAATKTRRRGKKHQNQKTQSAVT
jgi:hypothetical protein